MDPEFEKAVAGPATPSELAKVVRRARGIASAPELDVKRASKVQVGDRQWQFVMTRAAIEGWDRLGSQEVTVGVLIYEQPGAAAPFVHREIVVRPGKNRLVVEVRENGLARWTGDGIVNRGGALDFKVPIDRENAPKAGMMAGTVTRDGALRFTESNLPRPIKARRPELIAEEKG